MIPVISIIGRSNVGKTTVLESLIPELRRRGYVIAVAKHINEDVDLDNPGKDSWRLARAGADAILLSTPSKVAVIRQMGRETAIPDMQYLLGSDHDLFIIEGHKAAAIPKIEVRRGDTATPLSPPDQLLAVISDRPVPEDVPSFAFGETAALADLIERKFLGKRSSRADLFVNGKPVPLNPFVRRFIIKSITGMVSALKGVEQPNRLQVWLKLEE